MTDCSELLDDVKQTIRALILPLKNGLPFNRLDRDYHEVEGKRIPFRELGFNTLLEFVQSIKDVVQVQCYRNEYHLWPIANEETKHIQDLVQRQKTSSSALSKVSNRPRARPNRYYSHSQGSIGARTTTYSNLPPRMQTSSSAKRLITQHLNNQPGGIPFTVKDNIRALLKRYPAGIKLDNLKWAYIQNSGNRLEPEQLGYKSMEEFIKVLQRDNLLRVQGDQNTWTIYSIESGQPKSQLMGDTERVPNVNGVHSSNHVPASAPAQTNEWENSKVNPKILSNMRRVIERFPDGIVITELAERYQEVTGSSLDLHDAGYHDVQSLVNDLDNVFRISNRKNGEWLLTDARLPQRAETPNTINSTSSREPDEIPEDVQQNIYDLLKYQPDGFLLSEIEKNYEINFGEVLPWKELHFKNPQSFVLALQFNPPVRLSASGLNDYKLVLTTKERPAENIRQFAAAPPRYTLPPHDAVVPDEFYTTLKIGPEKDNEFFPVLVSEVENPGKIWLQLLASEKSRTNEELNHLMDQLESFYTSTEVEKYEVPDDFLRVNMVLAVMYPPDQNWHRGCIVAKKGPTTFLVLYFDYGTIYLVERKMLRLLKKDFLQLPAQAFSVRLSRIKPVEDFYSEESKQRLLNLTTDIPLMAQITNRQYRNTISVILCDTSTEDDVYINHVLVGEGLVLSCEDIDEPLRKPFSVTSPNLMLEQSQMQANYLSPSPVQRLDMISPISGPQPAPVFSNPFASSVPSMVDNSAQGYYSAGSSAMSQYLNSTGTARFPLLSAPVFQPSNIRMDFNPQVAQTLESALDPEVAKRVQEKMLAKRKLTIPQATVGPMQYSRDESAEPETVVPLTPARTEEREVHLQASPLSQPLIQASPTRVNTSATSMEEIQTQQQEEEVPITSLASPVTGALENDYQAITPARFCKRVTFENSECVVHLINFYGQPCFSSADVSLFVFVIDLVKKYLRMRKYTACHIVALREEHQELFQELEYCGATGFASSDPPSDKVLLYELSDVIKILRFLNYDNTAVLEEIESLARAFDPNDECWNIPLEPAEDDTVEDTDGLEEQLKDLMKELSLLAQSVDDSDRLVEVSQGIRSIQSKLKNLKKRPKQVATKSASELAQEFLDRVKPVMKCEDEASCSTTTHPEIVTAVPASTTTTAVTSVIVAEHPGSTNFMLNPRPRAAPGFQTNYPMNLHALPPQQPPTQHMTQTLAATQMARTHAISHQFHPMMIPPQVYFQGNYYQQTQIPPQFAPGYNNSPNLSNIVNFTNWQ